MNKKSLIIATILILAGIVGFWVWQKDNSKNTNIKIGVILPFTGELATYGNKIKNGIELAVNTYNENHTNKIELIIEDDKGETNNSVNALNKLISIDKVGIVIGTLTSGGTIAMASIAEKNNVILISPSASNPQLKDAGKFVYRLWASDDLDGLVSASYCYNKLGLRKMAISNLNNDYCTGLKNIFATQFISLGGEIVESSSYKEKETEFKPFITSLKSKNIDGVYLPGHPIGISSFLKQAKELSFSKIFFSNVAVEDKEFKNTVGVASEGLYYTSPSFDIKSKDTLVSNFVDSYSKKFNDTPDIFGVKGYETATVLIEAILAGNLSSIEISNFIDTKKTFTLLEGKIVFDKNGDITNSVSVKQISGKETNTIETINP